MSFQPQQQAIVEQTRVVNAVFVQDQRVIERTEFQQPVPVGAVARQPRYFQTEHDPGAAHADFRNQLAKTVTVHHRSPGLAQIAVDHRNLLRTPAEIDGPLPKSVLPFGALRVLEDLPQRRLAHVQVSVPPQMCSLHFIAQFDHGWMTTSFETSSASPASSIVNSAGTTTSP